MSILKKLAATCSRITSDRRWISAAESLAKLPAFTWSWSAWRKSGPRDPSRMAAARTPAVYSAGDCRA